MTPEATSRRRFKARGNMSRTLMGTCLSPVSPIGDPKGEVQRQAVSSTHLNILVMSYKKLK